MCNADIFKGIESYVVGNDEASVKLISIGVTEWLYNSLVAYYLCLRHEFTYLITYLVISLPQLLSLTGLIADYHLPIFENKCSAGPTQMVLP